MAKFIGRQADIGFKREATRGTNETSATFWIPKMSMSYDDGIEQLVDESSVGVIEDSADASVVGRFAVGEIEGPIFDRSFGLLLLNALGAVSTGSAAETVVYTHTFTVAQNAQHPALTVFLDDGNQDYIYGLGMIDSLQMEFALGQFAKYTASIRSKVGATATLSPSYTVENRFNPQHITFAFASNVAGLSSPTTVNVQSVNLTINKNIEDDRRLGSIDQVDILNRQMSVEGSLELVFDAETFKTQMLANTNLAVRIELTNSDVLIGTTLRPRIQIDLARVKFSSFEKNYENDSIVKATVNFKALYSQADTSMISIALRNTQVSY